MGKAHPNGAFLRLAGARVDAKYRRARYPRIRRQQSYPSGGDQLRPAAWKRPIVWGPRRIGDRPRTAIGGIELVEA